MNQSLAQSISPALRTDLRKYEALLIKWQKAVNLVAPSTLKNVWVRHFEDSLQILPHLPQEPFTLLDMGSGAGFPGLVVALARPDATVHLVESDSKKGIFLLNVSRETCAKNVHVHSQRIESIVPDLKADIISARALASLDVLLGMCASQWGREEGAARCIFLKGAGWRAEVEAARKGYDFALQSKASCTDNQAAILCISDVCAR